jgi:lysophospholipase L1-like esterase
MLRPIPPGWPRRAALAAAYALGLLMFFEASARLALSVDVFFARAVGEDDASWRLRWVRRQKGATRIYYTFDVHHPSRGWALKPGLREEAVFRGKALSSNSRGLRGSREFALEKPAGVTRILAFGDSFTFGEDVGDEEAWPRRLEAKLPGVEVLNFGVHGYGHDQMLLYLQEEGLRYHPDVVLLGFLSDDMERNLLAFRDYAKPRYVLEGGRLRLTHVPVPPPEQMLAGEPWRPKSGDLLSMLWGRARAVSGARDRETRQLTLALLDAMVETIHAAGARPAFAYLPVYGEITRTDMAMTSRERFFFSYCRQRGVQSLYLQRFFLARQKRGATLKAYGHWGAEEHDTAAEGMAAYLLEKGLVPSSPARPQ